MRVFAWACIVVSAAIAALAVLLAFGLGSEYGFDEALIVLAVSAPLALIPGTLGYALLHRPGTGVPTSSGSGVLRDLDPLLVTGLACTGAGVLIVVAAAGGGLGIGLAITFAGTVMSWVGIERMRHRRHG